MTIKIDKARSITMVPPGDLRPYENNAKNHTPEQIKALVNNIKRFGWDVPIVADEDGVIIKGHGRWMAAQELELKAVPVIYRNDMTKAEANAARLSDNQVAALTGQDTVKLQAELAALAETFEMEDLMDIGFSARELEMLTEDLGEMDEEALATPEDLTADDAASVVTDTAELISNPVILKEVFGFSRISGENAPLVKRWFTEVMAGTGEEGEAALVAYITAHNEDE